MTPYISHSAIWGFAPFALLLLATAILLARALGWIGSRGPAKPPVTARAVVTNLRLQFDHGDVAPHCVHETNVWRWYALAQFIRGVAPDGKTATQNKFWLLFIVFNDPVDFKEIRINAGGAKLPLHEVKDSGPRHAIIFFDGNMEGMVLEVSADLRK